MSVSFYIAKRYFFSKNGKNAINIINWLSFSITIISAVVLFVVLSGFAGLKGISLSHISFFDPDLRIEPKKGKTLQLNETQQQFLEDNLDIISYSKIIEERVFLDYNKKSVLTTIKGVDTAYQKIVALDSIMAYGEWFLPYRKQTVVGNGVYNALSMAIPDFDNTLKIIVPKPGKGQISSIKSAYNSIAVVPTGVYRVNEEIDKKYIYTSIELARELLKYDNNTFSVLEVKTNADADLDVLKDRFLKTWDQNIIIKDKFQLNSALYKMLNTENIALYLIGTLIVIIALFNVIGSLIMMILDKKSNLKTLYALGASISDIKNIFFYQGVIMTVLGGVIGIVLGFIIVFLQQQFEWVKIGTQAWPLDMNIKIVLLVLLTISILGILAARIAASRINQRLIS